MKPHVLFITEKYHSPGNLTNNFHNLFASLEISGLATYENCFVDPEETWTVEGVDDALKTRQYDAAIVSVYHIMPSQQMAQQVGHKMAYIWWDSVRSMDGVRHWSRWVHQICVDWGYGEEEPNIFCMLVPQDTNVFNRDTSIMKDIDISLCGSMTSYWSDRVELVKKIQSTGINIWANGGRGPGLLNLSIQDYANIHKRSKLCLNPQLGHSMPQRKGRGTELGLSGATMMANYPEVFIGKHGRWFEPNVDFIPFNDDDVIDKIKYYLEHEEERNIIADNIYKKSIENYAPIHFWRKVLNICGVNA